MARTKKKYLNGQKRGGGLTEPRRRKPKDYHAVELKFHGSESAYQAFIEGGRKGYQ